MKYLLFFTPMCIRCPSVKKFMKESEIEGEEIDASSGKGVDLAKKYNIKSVPTIVFLEGNEEKHRANSIDEIKKVVE